MENAITIEAIYDAKEGNNQDYQTLQLKQVIDKPSTLEGVASDFIKGGDFTEKRVVFQSMHKDLIKANGIVQGGDLNTLMGKDYRIQVIELTESDFQAQDEDYQKGFSVKINPESGAKLTAKGEFIWRKTFLVYNTEENADVLVAHDKVAVAVKP